MPWRNSGMILQGQALAMLRTLPDNSVHCVVTSPPYWGLRDYGCDGQIGLEATPAEYIAKMVEIFEEVRRVLRRDGTCWVNMGDTYSGSFGNSLKAKNLIGMPWRLALALQDAGWYLRSDIIWSKPNPMPSSVRDRPTTSHEYIFLLTKSAKYWYDADAIRTELKGSGRPVKMPDGWDTGLGGHGAFHRNGREKGATNSQLYGGPNSGFRVKHCPNNAQPSKKPTKNEESSQRTKVNLNANWDAAEANGTLKGANARTVWTIAIQGYKKAHFATFPTEIPRRCILAGCPPGGTVLDPFLGSGTTYAVALELARNAIGIELNPEYVTLARERIASVTPGMLLEAS